MYWHRVTNRPITSPGGGIVTSGVGEAAVVESRRHASRRANSTFAISVATQLGRSGIAHVIMNRRDNIICCKKHIIRGSVKQRHVHITDGTSYWYSKMQRNEVHGGEDFT